MATITTSTPAPEADTDPSPRPLSRLWQLPFFLLGLAAFLYVYRERPLQQIDSTPRQFERSLATIRSLLTRSPAEAATALHLAEQARDQATAHHPQRVGEATFLLGSAHLRRAETVTDPTKARDHLAQARKHLERVGTQPLPDNDAPRLQYRLAKALFLLEEAPERVVGLLGAVVEKADDPAEGYQMLARAHLRLPKPDLRAALEANERLRQVPLAGDEVLAQARLDAGELLLKLNQPDEARKVLQKLLAKVGSSVPQPIQSRARWLCAQSFQDENRFGEAATLWQQAAADTYEPAKSLGRVYFNLGYCFRRMEQPADALRAWEQCLRTGNGPEQRAAAVLLAELQLQHENVGDKALETLELALRGIDKPADWTNDLVEITRAAELCERGIATLSKAQPELAVRWTQLYQRIAPTGRAEELRGDLLAQLGRAILAGLPMDEQSNVPALREQGLRHLREAAKNLATAAAVHPDLATRADLYWNAATLALQTEDNDRATEWLIALLQLFDAPSGTNPEQAPVIPGSLERKGRAWYALAETLRQANSPKAEEAYRNCRMTVPPYSYRAQYHLALYALERGEVDDAEAILQQNLHWLRLDPDADKEAHERSLYALGGIYFRGKKYREVVRALEEALGRFPANPEATRAHLQLAQAYRQLSAREALTAQMDIYKTDTGRKHFDQERRRWLEKAADEFTAVAGFLLTQESAGHLSPEERINIPFTLAECRFDLGHYKVALEIYEHLIDRYKGTEDGLSALAGAARCHAALGQGDQVRLRLADIRAQLGQVNEAVRAPWEDWLIRASKPLSEPASAGPPGGGSNKPLTPTQQPGALQPSTIAPGQLQPAPGALGPERINPNNAGMPPG